MLALVRLQPCLWQVKCVCTCRPCHSSFWGLVTMRNSVLNCPRMLVAAGMPIGAQGSV